MSCEIQPGLPARSSNNRHPLRWSRGGDDDVKDPKTTGDSGPDAAAEPTMENPATCGSSARQRHHSVSLRSGGGSRDGCMSAAGKSAPLPSAQRPNSRSKSDAMRSAYTKWMYHGGWVSVRLLIVGAGAGALPRSLLLPAR